MEIPEPKGRGAGAVVREKKKRRLLILRAHASGALLISNRSASTGLATFEYSLPRTREPLFIPRRLYLPYGVWTEADGAEVLFARDYLPLWRIRKGSPPERVSPKTWIQYVKQDWFFADGNTPWDHQVRYEVLLKKLQTYGVRGLPKLVELLPALIHDSTGKSLRRAVEDLFGGEGLVAA
jgi:hypothetical protein